MPAERRNFVPAFFFLPVFLFVFFRFLSTVSVTKMKLLSNFATLRYVFFFFAFSIFGFYFLYVRAYVYAGIEFEIVLLWLWPRPQHPYTPLSR